MILDKEIAKAVDRNAKSNLSPGDHTRVGLYVRGAMGIPFEELVKNILALDNQGIPPGSVPVKEILSNTMRSIKARYPKRADRIDEMNTVLRGIFSARTLRIDLERNHPPFINNAWIDSMASLCARVTYEVAERMLPSPRYGIFIFSGSDFAFGNINIPSLTSFFQNHPFFCLI